MWIADGWKDYELLDCGGGEKLERWGDQILVRPDPQAIWESDRKNRGWRTANARYSRSSTGGGHWDKGKLPENWPIAYKNLRFQVKPMNFKHTGLFPEQAANWDYIFKHTSDIAAKTGSKPKVLNLFAYTGAASLAAKCAGADVTHLDSVRQVVTWAHGNQDRSGLDGIRWVVEDAMKFANREAKRGNLYQGVILDPPAYGHGPDGEKWKLDECLFDMMKTVGKILAPQNSFLVLNLYSNGFSAILGETVVRQAFGLAPDAALESGELVLRDKFGKNLPLSIFVRLRR